MFLNHVNTNKLAYIQPLAELTINTCNCLLSQSWNALFFVNAAATSALLPSASPVYKEISLPALGWHKLTSTPSDPVA